MGHEACSSCYNIILLRMSLMRGIDLDFYNRTVHVEILSINHVLHTSPFHTKNRHVRKGTHAVDSNNHQSQANLPQADVRAFDVRAFDADLASGINHVKRARACPSINTGSPLVDVSFKSFFLRRHSSAHYDTEFLSAVTWQITVRQLSYLQIPTPGTSPYYLPVPFHTSARPTH